MAQILDNDPNSNDFFYITGLSDVFGGGKNSFMINTTPRVVAGEGVSVSVKDINGNPLPTNIAMPYNSKYGGKTVTGTIYVTDISPSVKTGIGTITITATGLDSDNTQQPLTWTRNILIDPNRNTETQVSFFNLPYINIVPEIYMSARYPSGSYVFGSGSFYSTAISPKNNYSGDYDAQFTPTVYQVYLTSGTAFSSSMQGEKIRLKNVSVKSFTYTNNANNALTFAGSLNTDFIATVKQIINENTLLLDVPFSTVSNVITTINQNSEYARNDLVSIEGYIVNNDPSKQSVNYKKNFYILSLTSGEFEIIYKSVPDLVTTETGSAKSLLNIEFRNIRVMGGNLDTYKIFGKSLSVPQSRVLLAEGDVSANETIISTNFNNGYKNLPGVFYSSGHLSRFWLTSSNDITFKQDNSILINGSYLSSSNTNESDYVIFKDDSIESSRTSDYISANMITSSYWYGESQAFGNSSVYPSASYPNAVILSPLTQFTESQENILSGKFHNSNPVKLCGNCLYNFTMLVRADTKNRTNSKLNVYFVNGTDQTQIGVIDSSFKFGANQLYSSSFFVPNTRYGTIKLVPSVGAWYLADISIKPYQSKAYSIDCFSIKVPIQNSVPNELFEIEAELYDGSGRLCYGMGSYTFENNVLYAPLLKQVYVDVEGRTNLAIISDGTVSSSIQTINYLQGSNIYSSSAQLDGYLITTASYSSGSSIVVTSNGFSSSFFSANTVRTGTASFVGGSASISDPYTLYSTIIEISYMHPSGSSIGAAYLFSKTSGSGFVLKSTAGSSDISTVFYRSFEL
jgi:hypothetical protein